MYIKTIICNCFHIFPIYLVIFRDITNINEGFDFGKLENAKKLLEDEITTQNVELEKAKGEYSNESELSEDRAKEIESDTVEAGKPRPAGEAGETNKKFGFDSPQEDTKKEDKTKVEIEGNNDEVVVKENEETTEESIKENCNCA